MPNKSETNFKWEDYFYLPNPGLRSYFNRVKEGQPNEYRTPFYKCKRKLPPPVSKILVGWAPTLNKLKSSWPTLWKFENDQREKVGPMSIMKPLSERMEDIDSYYDSILLESKPISVEAMDAVLTEWNQVRGLRLRSQANTLKNMKLSTSSGAPYFYKRKEVIADTYPCTGFADGPEIITYLPRNKTWKSCAILGWRGQEGGPNRSDVKQRVVWMFPFSVNLMELQFYQPLIEAAQKCQLVPAWGSMDLVDAEITKLLDTKGKSDLVVCTDFEKFDQHFNESLQDCAYYIFERILTRDDNSKRWLNDVFPMKYMIPLAYSWKSIRFGKHGMGSGSGGTNADETVVHRALQYEAALAHGQRLNPHSQCLGDDGVLSYPGITVDDVVDSYTAHGLDMNETKQYASTTDLTYLRRWHHKDYRVDGICVGVYSTYRALGRLAEQERFYDPDKWNAKMVCLRELSIIENCKWHPLREEFADYCIKGDKYRLGLDIPGFLNNIEKEAMKAIDEMPDFLGYTKSLQKSKDPTGGIKDWWIVNYLKSKT